MSCFWQSRRVLTKFGQHKHKFWGYGYNDLCYSTHDKIIFSYQSEPINVIIKIKWEQMNRINSSRSEEYLLMEM